VGKHINLTLQYFTSYMHCHVLSDIKSKGIRNLFKRTYRHQFEVLVFTLIIKSNLDKSVQIVSTLTFIKRSLMLCFVSITSFYTLIY